MNIIQLYLFFLFSCFCSVSIRVCKPNNPAPSMNSINNILVKILLNEDVKIIQKFGGIKDAQKIFWGKKYVVR